MNETFDPGWENPQELPKRHLSWINQKIQSFVNSSPLLEEWKNMDKERKFDNAMWVSGVTLTSIVGAMAFHEPDAKFMAEVSGGIAGGLLTTDAILRIGRFLKEKLGLVKTSNPDSENR